jgi:hypothetical protein
MVSGKKSSARDVVVAQLKTKMINEERIEVVGQTYSESRDVRPA